jgi:hypothetical protein
VSLEDKTILKGNQLRGREESANSSRQTKAATSHFIGEKQAESLLACFQQMKEWIMS